MTKPDRVTLATAVGKAAGRGVTPLEEALGKAATGEERKRRSPRGEGRRREEDRQGLLIYVSPETHHELKLLAVHKRTTMQALCAEAIRRLATGVTDKG